MATQAQIKQDALAFAKADIAIWKSDTDGIDKGSDGTTKTPNFVGASDALFFGDETKLSADKLPKDNAAIKDWITGQKELNTHYAGLNATMKEKAVAYIGFSIITRAAKDALTASAGEDVVKAIQGPIDTAGEAEKLDTIKVDELVGESLKKLPFKPRFEQSTYTEALKQVQAGDAAANKKNTYSALGELAAPKIPSGPRSDNITR